jgi:phospholipase/lecithinase/hemolysin
VRPFCSLPDEFVFWDFIHPTRAGHALIAEAALAALSAP